MTLLPEPREIRRLPRNGPSTPPRFNHDFPAWQPAAEAAPAMLPTVEILMPTGEWVDLPDVTPALVLSAEHLPAVTHQMTGLAGVLKRSSFSITFPLAEFPLADFLVFLPRRARRRLRKKLKLITHYRKKLERIPAWKLRQQQREEQRRGHDISFVIHDEAQNL